MRRTAEFDLEVLESTPVAPIAYEYRVPCFVPIGTCGTMNEQWTSNTVWILKRVMTVVPGMAVLGCLEVVCVSVISSNRTLRDAIDSVRCVCV